VGRIDGMLNYYMHIPNPEELPDEVWAVKWQMLKEIRKLEAKK